MAGEKTRDAWVSMPEEAQLRTLIPPGSPYDFGFSPGDDAASHGAFQDSALFGQIMFAPEKLSRREREMVAAVATAAQDCHY